MDDAQDQRRLRRAANAFAEEMKAQELGLLLRISSSSDLAKCRKEESDGWSVRIADGPGEATIQLWLDDFLDAGRRCLWFGFTSKKKGVVARLIDNAPLHRRPRIEYGSGDISWSKSDKKAQLKNAPSENSIKFPIQERYAGENISFYGMYDKGGHGTTNPEDLDTGRATDFIRDVVTSSFGEEPLLATEGGRRHAQVELAVRNSALARECKERDGYRCQVCSFHFQECYGVYGKRFAEAHHTLPLAKLKKPKNNSADDLVTVCANCHRMLHRMQGRGKTDLNELRKIFLSGPVQK
jgi:hypothetical protein